MRIKDARPEPLAHVDLRFERVDGRLELDDVELQAVERAAHAVIAVLRLDDDLVVALRDRPDFLLLGERAEMALTAPVEPGRAKPVVEDAAATELHRVTQPADQIDQLRV